MANWYVLILLNIVYAAIEFSDAEYYWGLIPTLFPILIISYLYFLRRVTISPEGIRYTAPFKQRFLRWPQVKMVGVIGNRTPATQIFVHDEKAKYPDLLTAGDYEEMILLKFRPEIMHHILCYWDGDIVNLQNVRAWRKYLINNGTTSGQGTDISESM